MLNMVRKAMTKGADMQKQFMELCVTLQLGVPVKLSNFLSNKNLTIKKSW